MDKEKTLQERMLEETLSDNSHVENCKQCKDCIFRDDGTVWSNSYQKGCCQIYQYPNMKPLRVVNNTGTCEYYSNKDTEES